MDEKKGGEVEARVCVRRRSQRFRRNQGFGEIKVGRQRTSRTSRQRETCALTLTPVRILRAHGTPIHRSVVVDHNAQLGALVEEDHGGGRGQRRVQPRAEGHRFGQVGGRRACFRRSAWGRDGVGGVRSGLGEHSWGEHTVRIRRFHCTSSLRDEKGRGGETQHSGISRCTTHSTPTHPSSS